MPNAQLTTEQVQERIKNGCGLSGPFPFEKEEKALPFQSDGLNDPVLTPSRMFKKTTALYSTLQSHRQPAAGLHKSCTDSA